MARISKKAASAATQVRLAKVLGQVGALALQPASSVLSTLWAQAAMAFSREQCLLAMRLISATIGFDYGPVGLTLLRWITINRLTRQGNEQAAELVSKVHANVAPPKAAPAAPQPASSVTGGSIVVVSAGTTYHDHGVAGGAINIAPVQAGVAPAPVGSPAPTPLPPLAPVASPAIPETPLVEEEPVVVVSVPDQPEPDPEPESQVILSPAEIKHPEWNWQPAAKVFGVRSLKGHVALWPRSGEEGAHPRVPPIDPNYVWPRDHLQWALFALNESPAKGLWAWGNRGAGKTEFARQIAARTGRPFYGITFSRTMEPSEFLGDMGAHEGGSVWQDGTMLQALRCVTPAVVLLDEISYGQSSHISGPLNEIVHPACAFNVPRTGERVAFSEGHLFLAADNTNGTGDSSGMFVGANQINRATSDRFSFFRRFTYLDRAEEIRLLKARAGCDDNVAKRVWSILDALRKKVDSGLLSDPPSTREAIAFACALRGGFDEKDAFETTFVQKYAEESQEEMRVSFVSIFESGAQADAVPA